MYEKTRKSFIFVRSNDTFVLSESRIGKNTLSRIIIRSLSLPRSSNGTAMSSCRVRYGFINCFIFAPTLVQFFIIIVWITRAHSLHCVSIAFTRNLVILHFVFVSQIPSPAYQLRVIKIP